MHMKYYRECHKILRQCEPIFFCFFVHLVYYLYFKSIELNSQLNGVIIKIVWSTWCVFFLRFFDIFKILNQMEFCLRCRLMCMQLLKWILARPESSTAINQIKTKCRNANAFWKVTKITTAWWISSVDFYCIFLAIR